MPLIVKIVPDSSIVGMILETPEPMRVVRSDQKGVMQHLTFSWQVSGNDFEYLPQVSPSSQLFNRSLNGWLESLSTEGRERAVDALFSVLRSSHADSISDLMAVGLKAVPTMINTFVGLSEADRRHLIEAMGLLMAAVRPVPRGSRLVPEPCFANREKWTVRLFSDHPPHDPPYNNPYHTYRHSAQ